MTHDRTDRLPLDPAEPRCEPSAPCAVHSKCARYIAWVPKGAPMADYSLSAACGGTALCPGYLDAAAVRLAEAKQPAPKPAVRGM